MTLKLKHFDTKTKQDTGVEEKLEHTLAEYLFPKVKFSIGTAYPQATIPEDLKAYQGMSLQFSSRERMYFANDSSIRSQLYPNPSDGAAYPLPFTPCESFHELRNVRILVIDDITGESGNIIARGEAKKLVGDCQGLIDKDFAKANSMKVCAFQFRIGIRPQEASPVMRIAKGTLAPLNLDKLDESSLRISGSTKDDSLKTRTGYDMVLATSSFKGRKGKDAIKPGEYILDIGLGVKSVAKYREHSLGTQVLVNYPRTVKQEILPIIKKQAEKLALEQKDIRKLAQRYINHYERRRAFTENIDIQVELGDELEKQLRIFDCLYCDSEHEEIQPGENINREYTDLLIYSLLKADINGYCQILEHPKIVAILEEFARREWVEIATGRSIKFKSGLAQPNLELEKGEICIPYLKEGEEIIVTRSPLINSNGVITLKNRHLSHMQQGCAYIHPKTAMDNMQCDFDGDLLAFAPASQYPILATEVKERNLPENRYPDIIKKDKIPYQGTFTEIAVSAMENKIGIIANEIQKNIALQCEIDEIPPLEKSNYLQNIGNHLNHFLSKYNHQNLQLSPRRLNQISKIAQVKNITLNQNQIDTQLNLFKQLLKDCVSELCNELQIATDGAKSALRPDNKIIQYCQAIAGYKQVKWLLDKKNPEAFIHSGIATNGFSPIDLMIQQTNQIFEQSQIEARPVEQFRSLYPEIQPTLQEKQQAQIIKNEYNSLIKQSIEIQERKKVEAGPYMIVTSSTSNRKLEITNLIKYETSKNPNFWKFSEIDIKIHSTPTHSKSLHPLTAHIEYKDSQGQKISKPVGTISLKSTQEFNLKPGMTIKQGKVEFHFGISDGIVDVLKQQTKEYVESVRNSTPEDKKLKLAAAIHDVSHTPDNKNYSGLKRASVAFTIFPEIVIEQLKQLQFTQMRVIGTQFNEFAHQSFNGEQVLIEFEDGINPRDPNKTARWIKVEGKKLGIVDMRSPNLISGSKALANIHSPPSNSIIASSLRNPQNQLKIDSVNKYDFASHQWKGETTYITFDLEQTHSGKVPKVFALIDDRVLGVVNKQSVSFLQQQLKGRSLQGLKIKAKVDKAPASYVDIVIDPDSVEFPALEVEKQQKLGNVVSDKQEVINAVVEEKLEQEQQHSESSLISFSEAQLDKSDVCKVLFFAPPVTQQFKERTEQVMSNMLQRAVDRAVQNGFGTVEFIDVSPISHKSPLIAQTLHQLQEYRKDIKVELTGTKSLEEGMRLLTRPSDIAIGVKSIASNGIIEVLANQGKAVASYIPETGNFDRRNLPTLDKKHEIERD